MSKLSRAAKRLARISGQSNRSAAAPAATNHTTAAAAAPAPTPNPAPARARATGPRTPEGKAISSQNARKHGLTSAAIYIPEDLREEYKTMSDSLQNELQPHGALENTVFEHLLRAAWNIYRIGIFEDQILTCPENLTSEDVAAAIDRHNRYRTTSERTFYKALKQLQELQTNRVQRDTEAADLPANLPLLAKITTITKRTPTPRTAPRSRPASPAPPNYETNSPTQNRLRSDTAVADSLHLTPTTPSPANCETNSPTQNRLRSDTVTADSLHRQTEDLDWICNSPARSASNNAGR